MKNLLILYVTLGLNLAFGQGEFNNWHFGNQAGINFNTNPATPLTSSAMSTFESCSSLSDANGNLLFYTNGGPFNFLGPNTGGVWNSNHQLMPNGDLSASTTSCNSAQQGALVIPDPAMNDQYYIFTVDPADNPVTSGTGGLRYHKVDMTLDGGSGDVTLKDVPVIPNTVLTEGLLAVRHSNQTDFWVIVSESGTNYYHSVLVNSAGVQPPITSTIGNSLNQQAATFCSNSCGTTLAITYFTNESFLVDFNNTSGFLSNPFYLGVLESSGCAFSPNDQFLYISDFNGDIFQFDLYSANIVASSIIIGNDLALTGSLRLAPDGKIYYPRFTRPHLGAIENPNSLGISCNLDSNSIALPGSNALALPNFYFKTNCEPSSISNGNTERLRISPNPFINQIILESGANDPINKVNIYTLSGSVIWSNTYLNTTEIGLDLNLESGTYILETINSKGYSEKSKIVKL